MDSEIITLWVVRHGRAGVGELFTQLAANATFSQFEPKDLIATGDKVVTLGHDTETTSAKIPFHSDFEMVFTLKNGKAAQFQEFCDSAAVNAAY